MWPRDESATSPSPRDGRVMLPPPPPTTLNVCRRSANRKWTDESDLHQCAKAAEEAFALFLKAQKQQEPLSVVENHWCSSKCVSVLVHIVCVGVCVRVHAHPALSPCGVLSLRRQVFGRKYERAALRGF